MYAALALVNGVPAAIKHGDKKKYNNRIILPKLIGLGELKSAFNMMRPFCVVVVEIDY
jgi:hypothetical protein